MENAKESEKGNKNNRFRMRDLVSAEGNVIKKLWKISMIFMKLETQLKSEIPSKAGKERVTLNMKIPSSKRPPWNSSMTRGIQEEGYPFSINLSTPIGSSSVSW